MAGKSDRPAKTTTTDKAKSAPRRVNKTVLVIAFWCSVLIIVGYLSFTASRNNALAPNRSAEKALESLKANDDAALYNLGSEEFKKASSQDKVKGVTNEWSKVINQATEGDPELVSKQQTTEDGKSVTTLLYRYKVKPGKSKIDQEYLYVQVGMEQNGPSYQLRTFNIDVKPQE